MEVYFFNPQSVPLASRKYRGTTASTASGAGPGALLHGAQQSVAGAARSATGHFRRSGRLVAGAGGHRRLHGARLPPGHRLEPVPLLVGLAVPPHAPAAARRSRIHLPVSNGAAASIVLLSSQSDAG